VVSLLILLPLADSDIEDLPLYLLVSAPVLVGALVGAGLALRPGFERESSRKVGVFAQRKPQLNFFVRECPSGGSYRAQNVRGLGEAAAPQQRGRGGEQQ
jgi:hypothetical protein